MKKYILYILVFQFFNTNGQNTSDFNQKTDDFAIQYDDSYEIIEDSYFGKLHFDTIRNNNGTYEIGNVAISKTGDITNIKVGIWKIFDKSGDSKSFGEYKIGSYIACCTYGPCKHYYNYKFGKWIYYYGKGQLKALGNYSIKINQIETSCEGGDKAKVHVVNDDWKYWDERGKPIKINNKLKEELEINNF